jgi:hypothetical protein
MKRAAVAARLFAQGWLPFQKHLVRGTPDRGKLPDSALEEMK